MNNSHVIPVMDYSLGIWRYSKSEEGDNIQNRVTRLNTKIEYYIVIGINNGR